MATGQGWDLVQLGKMYPGNYLRNSAATENTIRLQHCNLQSHIGDNSIDQLMQVQPTRQHALNATSLNRRAGGECNV
jgi:hypothetical protein